MTRFHGTYTALVTPFRNERVDLDALRAHVERQIDAGVDGLVPCGTTGESPTLSPDEYRDVITCVVQTASKRVPIVAGAGTNSTAKSIERANQAAECGVDGLLMVAPYYNKPSQAGLTEHFAAIARAVSLPIVLYNIPGRSGVEIAVSTIRALYETYENIVAVKHATGSVGGAADVLAACDIDLLSGDDPLTLPLMSLGAVGSISALANVAPRAVKRVTQAALAGDWPAALAAHRAIYLPAKTLLALDTNPIPVKTLMAMRGWCTEDFRLPLCAMDPDSRDRLSELASQGTLE